MKSRFIAILISLIMLSIPAFACSPTNQGNNSTGNVSIGDFWSNCTSGPAPLHMNFGANVSGNVTNYLWTFEPVSKDYYSKHFGTALHTYTKPGNYTVTLQVSGPDGKAVMTKVGYINVTGKTQCSSSAVGAQVSNKGTAATTAIVCKTVKVTPCKKTITFTPGKLIKSGATYVYNFGNGKTITTKCTTLKYTYPKAGTYHVTCTVKASKCGNKIGNAIIKVE